MLLYTYYLLWIKSLILIHINKWEERKNMSSSVGLELWRKQVLCKIFYELDPKFSNSYLMAECERLLKHNFAALLPISDQNVGKFLYVMWSDIVMIQTFYSASPNETPHTGRPQIDVQRMIELHMLRIILLDCRFIHLFGSSVKGTKTMVVCLTIPFKRSR